MVKSKVNQDDPNYWEGSKNCLAYRMRQIKRYDWSEDPNGYSLIYDGGSYPDPRRCSYCGHIFVKESDLIHYCGSCSKAMSMGGESGLAGYNAVIENARIKIPDKYDEFIDWQRFDIKFVIGQIQAKYQILLGRAKQKVGSPVPIQKNITVDFEEIQNKIPLRMESTSRPEFKSAIDL